MADAGEGESRVGKPQQAQVHDEHRAEQQDSRDHVRRFDDWRGARVAHPFGERGALNALEDGSRAHVRSDRLPQIARS